MLSASIYLLRQKASEPLTKEAAIKQAQEYKPKGICSQALVPAVHTASGAKYTFSSGCLAPGWEPEEKSINPKSKDAALKQAQQYQPTEACTDALVPAEHKASGAKFTFPSGCLPPGWEPEH